MPEPSRRVPRQLVPIVIVLVVATLVARSCGYKVGLTTVVRCRLGHRFSTIWIPGATVKSLDLVVVRLQRCPVGHHWSLVRPVREADLSPADLEEALAARDVRLP